MPMYRRVYAVLREEIAEGVHAKNNLMPSEAALAKRFSTSRITIRKALGLLQDDGYTTTRHGVGTFTRAKLPASSQVRTFTLNLTDMWQQTTTELLEYGMIGAPKHVADMLELPVDEEVHKAVRLRRYRQQPIGLLTTFIHKDLGRNFTPESFVSVPLFKLYAQVGIPSMTARQRITARSADPFAATHLKIDIGTPVLCMMRVSRDATGRAISYLIGVFRPDRYELEVDMEVDGPGLRAVWKLADQSVDSDS